MILGWTTKEQTERLIKVGLPVETADMSYKWDFDDSRYIITTTPAKNWVVPKYAESTKIKQVLPCWSLDALIDIINSYNEDYYLVINSKVENNEILASLYSYTEGFMYQKQAPTRIEALIEIIIDMKKIINIFGGVLSVSLGLVAFLLLVVASSLFALVGGSPVSARARWPATRQPHTPSQPQRARLRSPSPSGGSPVSYRSPDVGAVAIAPVPTLFPCAVAHGNCVALIEIPSKAPYAVINLHTGLVAITNNYWAAVRYCSLAGGAVYRLDTPFGRTMLNCCRLIWKL